MHEEMDLLLLQTLEIWEQSLAWDQKSQTSGTIQETLCQMHQPLQNHTSHILCSLLAEATQTVEDLWHVSCLSIVTLPGDFGTWLQLPTAPTGTYQNRREIWNWQDHQPPRYCHKEAVPDLLERLFRCWVDLGIRVKLGQCSGSAQGV